MRGKKKSKIDIGMPIGNPIIIVLFCFVSFLFNKLLFKLLRVNLA